MFIKIDAVEIAGFDQPFDVFAVFGAGDGLELIEEGFANTAFSMAFEDVEIFEPDAGERLEAGEGEEVVG